MRFPTSYAFKLFLLVLAVPMIWVFMSTWSEWHYLENITLDWRVKVRGEMEAPVKLMYVDIDSEAIKMMGECPIPRAFFASVVEALFHYGKARVIGIDVIFSKSAHSLLVDENEVAKDKEIFRKVIEEEPGLVLAATYALSPKEKSIIEFDRRRFLRPFPYINLGYINPTKNGMPELPDPELIGSANANIALTNIAFHMSPGPTPRWVPLFAHTPERTLLTLPLEMLRVYYHLPKEAVEIYSESIVIRNRNGKVFMKIPLTEQQFVEVNWFSRWRSDKNPRTSLGEVIRASVFLKKGTEEQKLKAKAFFKAFEGASILIGAVDPLLQDLSPAPFHKSPVPRVGLYGNLLKTFFSGNYLHRTSFWVNAMITFGFTLLMVGLGTYSGKYSEIYKMNSVFILLLYSFLVFYLFIELHWILPLIIPICSAISTTFLAVLIQLRRTEKQRVKIKSMFGAYVSKELVEEMVLSDQNPTLGGDEKSVTALFSDIEGFTGMSEILPPKDLVELINEYFSAMTAVIQEGKGTLDKYVGDRILGMFGAPLEIADHAYHACLVACKMQDMQQDLCEKWKSDSKDWPQQVTRMRTRIGINTGPMIVGNMGSQIRFNYTMMGDHVNLASRCEELAKEYGIYNIVSDYTRLSVEERTSEFLFRFLDYIAARGRKRPVKVHELVGLRKELSPEVFECTQFYEEGLKHYFEKNWDVAQASFSKSKEFEKFLPHYVSKFSLSPSLIFINRCEDAKNNTKTPIRTKGATRSFL